MNVQITPRGGTFILGDGGGTLGPHIKFGSKFVARSGPVHQIRGRTWEVYHKMQKLGKNPNFGVISEIHGSQRCLGSLDTIQRQNTNSKKLAIKKLSKSGLRRCTKFGQANSNNERKITLSLILHFIWDFQI